MIIKIYGTSERSCDNHGPRKLAVMPDTWHSFCLLLRSKKAAVSLRKSWIANRFRFKCGMITNSNNATSI